MSFISNKKHSKGILRTIKAFLDRNRLGELLVLQNNISEQQLSEALILQSAYKRPLGDILVELGLVSRGTIRVALAKQFTLRCLAGIAALVISYSAMNVRDAFAESAGSNAMPSGVTLASASISSAASYPRLFGTVEKRSGDMAAFTKWEGMFSRFQKEIEQSDGERTMAQLKSSLDQMRGLPIDAQARRVNDLMNSVQYISDKRNWGRSDYWATPIEFLERGGDCEDFAIAKYAALRALGVPDSRMRVAIVKDTQKNIAHAILIVYGDDGPMILDNQIKTVRADNSIRHYKPIYSINRTAWWLHTAPKATQVASR
jgi:predicted transglutaminase-like cysteine proteinase